MTVIIIGIIIFIILRLFFGVEEPFWPTVIIIVILSSLGVTEYVDKKVIGGPDVELTQKEAKMSDTARDLMDKAAKLIVTVKKELDIKDAGVAQTAVASEPEPEMSSETAAVIKVAEPEVKETSEPVKEEQYGSDFLKEATEN